MNKTTIIKDLTTGEVKECHNEIEERDFYLSQLGMSLKTYNLIFKGDPNYDWGSEDDAK